MWPRKNEEHNMPERSGYEREIRHAALNTPIHEDCVSGPVLGNSRPGEEGSKLTEEILVKTVPSDGQLGLGSTRQIRRIGVDFRLPEQIVWIDLEPSTKHLPSIISC